MVKKIKKGEHGQAVTYISRLACLKRLQLNMFQFRNLCILKGVYPREPKHKANKARIYYFAKDIQYLSRDPNIDIIRARTALNKRIKKAKGRGEDDYVIALYTKMPHYKIDHIIKERYPTFNDALRDIDDALTLMYLFSCYRSVRHYTPAKAESVTRKLREFEAYIVKTQAIRKSFVSIKGIYYEAEILGQRVLWMTPHQFLPIPEKGDVDMLIMTTFLEFYDCLLGFVLYKLYNLLGLHYPPVLKETRHESGVLENLLTQIEINNDPNAMQVDLTKQNAAEKKEVERRIGSLDTSKLLLLDQNQDKEEVQKPDSNPIDDEFQQEQQKLEDQEKSKNLFKGLKFYISREVPKTSLELIIRSFGGDVAWEGVENSKYPESDDDITHQIVDRDGQKHQFFGRAYIQPQWVYDCANEKVLLPVAEYGPTVNLPPHLSPFIEGENNDRYIPQRRIYLDRLKESLETGTPFFGEEELEEGEKVNEEDDEEDDEEQENGADNEEDLLENLHAQELKAELAGKSYNKEDAKKTLMKANAIKRKAAEKEAEEEKKTLTSDQIAMSTSKAKRKLLGIQRREKREEQRGDSLKAKRRKLEEQEATQDKSQKKKKVTQV